MYAATRAGIVFRSTDRGANWEQRNTADLDPVRRLLVHPSQTDTLSAASANGFHFSDNGGEIWDNRYAEDVLDARMDPLDSSIIYIAVGNIGVLKTYTLGFGPWETVLPWSSADAPVSQMIKLALGYRLMITKNGDRWPVKQPDDSWDNLPDWEVAIDNGNDPMVSVEFVPATPGKAYAISSAGKVFTKDDVNAAGDWADTGQWTENGVRQLAIDATDAQLPYATSANQVGRSENGSATWSNVGGASLPNSEFNSIVAHPSNSHRLYLGADIGVFDSDDRGDSWTPFDQDLPNAEILQIFWEGAYLYAVTYGRGLWRRRPC